MVTLYFIICSFIFFVLLLVGILSIIYKRDILVQRRALDYLDLREMKNEEIINMKARSSFVTKISSKVKRTLEKKMRSTSKRTLEKRLRDAGYPLKMSPVDFRLLQIIIGASLFFCIFLLLGQTDVSAFQKIAISLLIGFIGMYYANFYLSALAKKRMIAIQKSMPDFFDMVTLSIEAGIGLDAALMKVCKQTKGPLSEEFLQTIEEMNLGKSRREAFSSLRTRVPVHSFQSIISSLIQADMLGIGMTKALRSLTERIREQRVLLAREQAMKAPVKMIFPMLLFIFPAIFIVLLGPLVIYLLQIG